MVPPKKHFNHYARLIYKYLDQNQRLTNWNLILFMQIKTILLNHTDAILKFHP